MWFIRRQAWLLFIVHNTPVDFNDFKVLDGCSLGSGPIFTNSLDLRLDLRLGLDTDRVSLETRVKVKSYSQRKIVETRLSRDLSYDVSLISRRCFVCVTFFHSKSIATIVTSSRIHDSNIAVHGCARTWIRDGDKMIDTPCSRHNIFEHTKLVINTFVQ